MDKPEFITWAGLDSEGSPTIGVIISRNTAAQLYAEPNDSENTRALRVNVAPLLKSIQKAKIGDDIYVQIVVTDSFQAMKEAVGKLGNEHGIPAAPRAN